MDENKLQLTLKVDGMCCNKCPDKIQKSLAIVEGVDNATVDFETKTVTVSINGKNPAPRDLVNAIRWAGYEVELPG
jgi:copper chaperone CopZ